MKSSRDLVSRVHQAVVGHSVDDVIIMATCMIEIGGTQLYPSDNDRLAKMTELLEDLRCLLVEDYKPDQSPMCWH